MLKLTVQIPGSQQYVSAEVALKYLAKALAQVEFTSGTTDIFQDNEGKIFVNGKLVHTPKEALRIKTPNC